MTRIGTRGTPKTVSFSRKTATKSRRTPATKSVTKKSLPPSAVAVRPGVPDVDATIVPISELFLGKTVYRVQFLSPEGDCVNYVDDARSHVVFQLASGEFVVFALDGTEVPNEVVQRCARALTKRRVKSRHVELAADIILLQYCRRDVDLTAAQGRLADLNRVLQETCPNLELKLAPFYEYLTEKREVARYTEKGTYAGCRFYETLLLSICRHETGRCVSSIELHMVPGGSVFISSKTDPKDEGKKYNKLLRSVLMMVVADIPGAIQVESTAKNPISAWLLIQYHHATIVGEAAAELAFVAGDGPITQDIIREFYTQGGPDTYLQLRMPLDARNAETAYAEFMTTLGHGLVC